MSDNIAQQMQEFLDTPLPRNINARNKLLQIERLTKELADVFEHMDKHKLLGTIELAKALLYLNAAKNEIKREVNERRAAREMSK